MANLGDDREVKKRGLFGERGGHTERLIISLAMVTRNKPRRNRESGAEGLLSQAKRNEWTGTWFYI